MAAAKNVRKAVVNGAEHTDASLAAMKTTEVAGLVAAIRGDGKTPKPATKAKAVELFWQAAKRLPETPEAPKAPEKTPRPRPPARRRPPRAPLRRPRTRRPRSRDTPSRSTTPSG
jgi:hypothetical protein